MIEPSCTRVRDSAAEFALDILPPIERSAIAAHLLRCASCREEVDSLVGVGARLLELVPGTEPPLGFDRRVLARMHLAHPRSRRHVIGALGRRRPRLLVGVAATAAAVAVALGPLGLYPGRETDHTPSGAILAAEFHQGSHDVGMLYGYPGSPPWFSMTVRGATGSDTVTCELVGKDGSLTPIGSFVLVRGRGSWGAPEHGGFANVAGAQLVGSDGRVIAWASFGT
jgi:hypothetical protein